MRESFKCLEGLSSRERGVEEPEHRGLVDVAAGYVGESLPEQPVGLAGGFGAVESEQREEVYLEFHVFAVQAQIVFLAHVAVTLGMGEDGEIPFPFYLAYQFAEVHRGVDVGGLDEQVVGVFAYREQFAGGESCLEEGVDHVFGGEPELYGA